MYGLDQQGSSPAKKRSYSPLGFASNPTSFASPNNSGQYAGGGAPKATPQASPGRVNPAGNPVPARKPGPVRKPKGKAKGPAIPGINQFLAGDTTYQGQVSDLQRALEQFKAQSSGQQNTVNQDFATALKNLSTQRDTDLKAMQDDFAARGLLNSGLFTDALSQYNTKYQQQTGQLSTDQQRSLADLLSGLQNYQTENAATLSAAKQDAIRRRATKYGITA